VAAVAFEATLEEVCDLANRDLGHGGGIVRDFAFLLENGAVTACGPLFQRYGVEGS
jgi:hypothetical protein